MPFAKYYMGDQIKSNSTGEACSAYGKRRDAYMVLVWKPKERDHLEDLGMDGRNYNGSVRSGVGK